MWFKSRRFTSIHFHQSKRQECPPCEDQTCPAGLPPHGLLVLMPTSMQLSASSSGPPTALTAALILYILPLQLSPAAVSSLYSISKAICTSAALPGQQTTTDGHAQSLQGHTGAAQAPGHAAGRPQAVPHKLVDVGSEKFDPSAPSAAAAATLQDDLRCGLFSLVSVPGLRPGEPMTP